MAIGDKLVNLDDLKVVSDNLKNALNQLGTGYIKLESGTYSDNDGATKTAAAWRIRNASPVVAKQIEKISMPSGYNIYWFALDIDGELLSHSQSWTNYVEKANLPDGTEYINFGIRNQSTPSAPTDISGQISTVQDGMVITTSTDGINDEIDHIKHISDQYVEKVNLYNGNTHSGIQSQTTGASYGTASSSDSFFYTDLIEIGSLNKIFVVTDFKGNSYAYVTFFNIAKTVIGSQNGYNPTIKNIPSGAVYFCVTASTAYASTLTITRAIPDDLYGADVFYGRFDNKIERKFIRIDRGVVKNYYPSRQNVGDSLFSLTSYTGIDTSYLVPIPGSGNVAYRNDSAKTLTCVYVDDTYTVVGKENLSSNTKGTMNIPSGAVAFVYAAGTFDEENECCFIEGTTSPDRIYKFNEITIDGLKNTGTDYLAGKSIVFDGDSITEGAGVTDITTGIAPNNNKGWGYWIQRNHPSAVCYGFGKSGWTVGKVEGETDSLLNHIPLYPESVDLFVLSGGYNDQAQQMAMGEIVEVTDGGNAFFNATFDEYTFCGALESWFQQLRENYPYAQIVYVITPKRVYSSNPLFNNDTKGVRVKDVLYSTGEERFEMFWQKIRDVCEKWSIKYLDLSKTSGVVGTGELTDPGKTIGTRYFSVDGGNPDFTHPNTNYYKKLLVPQIENLIRSVI